MSINLSQEPYGLTTDRKLGEITEQKIGVMARIGYQYNIYNRILPCWTD